MHLKVLLPFGIFVDATDVSRVVAQTDEGSFGLLPHRLDCVAAIAPGILTYETERTRTVYIAVDEGVLVKAGADVLVSVRHAIGSSDLDELRESVKRSFLKVDKGERNVRAAITKTEASFIRRIAEFHHE